MKKAIKAHEQKSIEVKVDKKEGAMPAYLLDRENINRSKVDFPWKGAEQHGEAEAEGEGWKMGGAGAESQVNERGRDVQGRQKWQETEF